MKNISLLMLSWGSHRTLINTLESYKKYGLLDAVGEKIIYFQELSTADTDIATKYGFDYAIGTESNAGIGFGIHSLMQSATKDYVLFLENDWELICNAEDTANRLKAGIELINSNGADVVRYRHRKNYGEPNYAAQFHGKELSRPNCILESLYWHENPDVTFESYIKKVKIQNEYFYTASSKNANFTNNPTLYKRNFYLNLIEPFFCSDFEPEKNMQSWWETQNFKVAQGEGLFTHNRIDR